MTGGIAPVARALGDDSRATMCGAMLDGRAWTVGELAEAAGVGKAAASEHVARLVEAGLVVTESAGRHKYVRLAGPHVAEVLELLGTVADDDPPRSLRAASARRRLAAARTCYDHLAGRLGVAVTDALLGRGVLDRGLSVTRDGRGFLQDLGVDVVRLEEQRRPLARSCLDLTERRPHLGGGLGAALLGVAEDRAWVRRPPHGRALEVTCRGERELEELLGIGPADLAAP